MCGSGAVINVYRSAGQLDDKRQRLICKRRDALTRHRASLHNVDDDGDGNYCL